MSEAKRLLDEVLRLLRASGQPFAVEHGKKHTKVKIDGRLVLVLSRGARADRAFRDRNNALAHVRRALRVAS